MRGASRGEMDNMELTHKYNRLQHQIEAIEQRQESEIRHLTALINEITEKNSQNNNNDSERIANKEAMLRDLLSIQADLIKHHELLDVLVSDSYSFYQLNQQRLNEIYQLLPSIVKYSWYHWVILTLLVLSIVLNSGLAIFLIKNYRKSSHNIPVSSLHTRFKGY